MRQTPSFFLKGASPDVNKNDCTRVVERDEATEE